LRQSPTVAFSIDTLRGATDFDRDDFSSLLNGGDCAAFNGAVNPSAREIPGNGLDDNCMLGDSAIVDDSNKTAVTSESAVDTSVILITVDTVRPDHLSVYGYPRPTTPNLNRFAATQAMVFDRAYSASAWTSLAISAMMRGLYPRRIEWTKVYETNRFRLVREEEKTNLAKGEKLRLLFTMPLDDHRKPLARQLRERGMYTAAVVDDGYAEFLSAKMGVADGFDRFETMDSLPKKMRTDKGTVDLAMKVLRQIPKDQEFFLWIHLFGPHDPNSRHRGVKKYGKTLVDKYDHELTYADKQLGRLIKRINWMSKSRRIAVALTSDHGEQFYKRRRYHGINLHEANIRVPLIISHPDWPAGRTDTLASLVDIAPTILAWTQTASAHSTDGDDLSPYALGYRSAEDRKHIAETWYVSQTGVAKRDLVAVFDGEHKVIHNRLRNLTRVVSQKDKRRRAKNLGRKFKPAKPLITELKRYLEDTSGPIWKN
jgi:choline-sulfatase